MRHLFPFLGSETHQGIDFESLEVPQTELEHATIPEMIALLPNNCEEELTEEEIKVRNTRLFMRGWQRISHALLTHEDDAMHYLEEFGISSDKEHSAVLLGNTVLNGERVNGQHEGKLLVTRLPSKRKIGRGYTLHSTIRTENTYYAMRTEDVFHSSVEN
jgi:hypothetical protein